MRTQKKIHGISGKIVVLMLLLCITGILLGGCTQGEPQGLVDNTDIATGDVEDESTNLENEDNPIESTAPEEGVFRDFINGTKTAETGYGTLSIKDLRMDEEDWESYRIGEQMDLDNDGEAELILSGPYGGMYIDFRDDTYYVLAEGAGTAGCLSYVEYKDAIWIMHSDTMHAGRTSYWLTKYDGNGQVTEEFSLQAMYDNEEAYNENSTFLLNDENITMQEYEEITGAFY